MCIRLLGPMMIYTHTWNRQTMRNGMGPTALPLPERKKYWRSLLRCSRDPARANGQIDPRLAPGLLDEMRVALRDALQELDALDGRQACRRA